MPLLFADLDNTLIDRDAAFRTAVAAFLASHGLPAADLAWVMDVDGSGHTPRDVVAAALSTRYPRLSEPISTLLDNGGADHASLPDATRKALLEARAQGWTCVIVTNGRTTQQEKKIHRTGLDHLVHGWVISESAGHRKPAPEIFHHAAELASSEALQPHPEVCADLEVCPVAEVCPVPEICANLEVCPDPGARPDPETRPHFESYRDQTRRHGEIRPRPNDRLACPADRSSGSPADPLASCFSGPAGCFCGAAGCLCGAAGCFCGAADRSVRPTVFDRLAGDLAHPELSSKDQLIGAAWIIGDSPHADIAAAVTLGLPSVWISNGRPWRETAYLPTYITTDAAAAIHHVLRSSSPQR